MIEIDAIDHVVLRVIDAAMMERFYCDVLGCTVETRRDDIGLLQLRAGASLVDLVLLVGYYQTICGVLNAFEIPSP